MKILNLLKRNLFSILFLLFTLSLVYFSSSSLYAAKSGLKLWANSVVPSLFSFLVAVELLKNTNILHFFSQYLDKLMKSLFNVSGIAAFPFIMGLLSGYPVGAKIISDLYTSNNCTKEEAHQMLYFCNNSGPLFILSTVGSSFYHSSFIGIALLIIHIISSIIVGIIFGNLSKYTKYTRDNKHNISFSTKEYRYSYESKHSLSLPSSNVSFSNFGTILSTSIVSSIKTLLIIGGFVTLFSVIISILEKTKIIFMISSILATILNCNSDIVAAILTGVIEFTNGLSNISMINLKTISVNLALSSFILGFGGISVLLQVLSILSKSHLSVKPYLIGKLAHGIISALLTFVFFSIPIFNLNI